MGIGEIEIFKTGSFLYIQQLKDINECKDNLTCPQGCENTVGSYICSCNIGFRLNTLNTSICDDINECEENIDDCSQTCVNAIGSYSCNCFNGYTLQSGVCEKNSSNVELCQALNCSQLCFVNNGTARCDCQVGFALQGDNKTCTNIDECGLAKKPCSQICTDTYGRFTCSCYAGFKLEADRTSCTACEKSFYGVNCNQSYQCSGHGTCDPVRGCVCDIGWEGVNCNNDIDECTLRTDNCLIGDVCVNALGSYSCVCPIGYVRNGTCQDINECVDPALNNCNPLIEDCVNNFGSHVCNCKPGYARNDKGDCININECANGDHQCQQICVDVPGKYNCDCNYGYRLNDDRLTCLLVKDVCSDFEKLNCSQGCTVDFQQNTSYWFCADGYNLVGKDTCEDINECEVSTKNLCSFKSGCVNRVPGYSCSCPPGSSLDNDGRNCNNCSSTTWGVNCLRSCSCSTGALRCDNVRGCICRPGYIGVFCDVDVNQCTNGELQCNDRQDCVSRIGPDSCVCKSGYRLNGTLCEDVNECLDPRLNTCQQTCQNSVGSYSCGCYKGFAYNASTNTCDDINECARQIDRCTSVCINTLGNYRCSCTPGYVLNRDGYTCDVTRQALNSDLRTCRDVDLCSSSSCSDLCSETPDNTSVICSCPPGKSLAANGIICQSCSDNFYGKDCSQQCNCNSFHSTCDKTNGTCLCNKGWTGPTCDDDVDECTNTSICNSLKNEKCVNTPGSYSCSCQTGYYRPIATQDCTGLIF
nr:mucin-4-like [Biomphalaria glabrata]